MPSRRSFLAGIAVSGLAPTLTWADAGDPRYLAAARMPDGLFRLFGLDKDVQPIFSLALPARGHAAASHPQRPEAVAFARRPGTFAVVLNCVTGRAVAELQAPEGRHFYGHGVFSADGAVLYTTENAYDQGEGRVGLWAANDGYRRMGEITSGGIGPHDIARLPGTETLVVANGGIDTHPYTGRQKLNIPTMQPNLCYLTGTGQINEIVQLAPEHRLNSIRHLAVRRDGLVAFGCQWQGDLAEVPPLLGLHKRGRPPRLLSGNPAEQAKTAGYVGSVAFSADQRSVGVTAPRGGRSQIFDVATGALSATILSGDICGIAKGADGFVFTTGEGLSGAPGQLVQSGAARVSWDNHLVDRQV
ncbi:MAG: DUF1513 domain-containing protein [Pseudomonadota bacterium]